MLENSLYGAVRISILSAQDWSLAWFGYGPASRVPRESWMWSGRQHSNLPQEMDRIQPSRSGKGVLQHSCRLPCASSPHSQRRSLAVLIYKYRCIHTLSTVSVDAWDHARSKAVVKVGKALKAIPTPLSKHNTHKGK